MRLGFIGLGNMGSRMANNLVADGHRVYIYDVYLPALDRVPGGMKCQSIAEVIAKCENVLFLSLPDPPAVEDVFYGSHNIYDNSKKDLIIVDCTTGLPSLALKIANDAKKRGMYYLDASVSGGVRGVEARTLSFFVGGDKEAYQRILPLIESLGKNIYYFDTVGKGLTVKLINNMISMSNLVTLIEGLNLGVKAGLDLKTLLEMFGTSSANSHVLQSKGPGILARNFDSPQFALNLGLKDLTLACSLAEELGKPLFMGNCAKSIFKMAVEQGFGIEDCNAVIKVFEEIYK